jgi:outer membrane protein insertion porin family/translocation and assembly module TamA
VATFCDSGDVSQNTVNIRLDHPHVSCGAGARYDTPVGPIRLDIGYRIQPLQVLGYPNENAAQVANPADGHPPELFSSGNTGLPIAISFGIGEAY